MTWTYSGDPSGSARDEIRFLVGDTDSTDELISDEEIAYLIARETGTYKAAVGAAHAIAAKFARLVDKSVDDLKLSYSQRQDHFKALAKRLEEDAYRLGSSEGVFAGGISGSRKETRYDDTDRVGPYFRRNQFDNPNTGVGDDDVDDLL